jgi:dolichyl-phosphate-mannose-protein mannosyltransferase
MWLRRGLLFVALGAAALLVYVPRTYRAVTVMGDSAELVAAGATWGVPHPPGYPLYTLIAHYMTRLEQCELPFRVHLSSAIFHALTVAVVGALIELVTGSVAAAFIGAAALALGRIFFLGSLYAEVFPLNDLFFACLLFSAIGIARAQKTGGIHVWRWIIFALLLGLSLAHHHMIVLAVPALAVLAGQPLWHDVHHRRRVMIGVGMGVLALPLFFYTLIPIAASHNPVPSWGDVRDLGAFWHLITRQDYGGITHASRRLVDDQLLERLDILTAAMAQGFGVMGVLLFYAGAIWGLRYERRICMALLLAVFCAGPVFAALNAFDIHSEYRVAFFERFITMCHVPFAVTVGFGAAQVGEWFRTHLRLPQRGWGAAMGVVASLVIVPLLGNAAPLDFSDNRRGSDYAHDLIASTPNDALVLLKSDMASQAALYACAVEHRCGDRIVVTPGQLWMPWKRKELARRYPALSFPPGDVASAARWLILQNLSTRPVFIHPELVDDVVHGELSILPSLLLFRVYPSEHALRSDLNRFRAEVDDVMQGRRCEICLLPKPAAEVTAADAQLDRIYQATLRAYATAAAQLEWKEEAEALFARLGKER